MPITMQYSDSTSLSNSSLTSPSADCRRRMMSKARPEADEAAHKYHSGVRKSRSTRCYNVLLSAKPTDAAANGHVRSHHSKTRFGLDDVLEHIERLVRSTSGGNGILSHPIPARTASVVDRTCSHAANLQAQPAPLRPPLQELGLASTSVESAAAAEAALRSPCSRWSAHRRSGSSPSPHCQHQLGVRRERAPSSRTQAITCRRRALSTIPNLSSQ